MVDWKPFILMVEDDRRVAGLNSRLLARHGYETACAFDANQARAALSQRTPDLLILDVMLPDGNGYDICTLFREQCDGPVLFLSGLKEPRDRVEGLMRGGDYYLTKPYDFDELLAVAESLLRREKQAREKREDLTLLTRGPLTLDIPKGRALVNGVDAGLTQKEFLLLLTLVQNEGAELSGERLYEEVWGNGMNADTQAVRQQIARLRRKLDMDGTDAYDILSAYGRGYRFISGR